MRWVWLLVCGVLTGCRFDLPAVPPDAPPDARPDARLCFGSGLGMLCLPSAPAMPRNLSGTLDTGIDSTCDHLVDDAREQEPDMCELLAAAPELAP